MEKAGFCSIWVDIASLPIYTRIMIPSLKNPLLKVERAKEHLDILDVELAKFQDSKPFRVSYKEYPQKKLYIMNCQIPIIDSRLAIIASDAVYNLRSALDHIAWQLALTTTKSPLVRTCFPIIDKNTSEKMGTFKSITRDIPIDAINEINFLQPYHRGTSYKDDFLWKLDKLCNIDKHRVIPAHGTAIDFKIPKSIKAEDLTFGELDNAYVVSMPISYKAQMQFQPKPIPDIVLGSEVDGLVISIKELPKIYQYIRDSVLPRFTGFFSK